MLLFECKFLCYHANQIIVSITTWSTSALLQIKGFPTKDTTVKKLTAIIAELIGTLKLHDMTTYSSLHDLFDPATISHTSSANETNMKEMST